MPDRPAIFLYTDAAEIDDATKEAMRQAGFLPVKVSDPEAVRFIGPEINVVSAADLSALQRAMLELLVKNPKSTIATEFGPMFAAVLLSVKS